MKNAHTEAAYSKLPGSLASLVGLLDYTHPTNTRILLQILFLQCCCPQRQRLLLPMSVLTLRGNGVSLDYTLASKQGRGSHCQCTCPYQDSVQFSRSVVSDLCDPMNRSMPGLPVHHQLPEFTQTHVHRVSDAIQLSHPLSSPSPPAPNPSQHQSLFQ